MAVDYHASKLSLADVLASVAAVEVDHGCRVRIVLWAERDKAGKAVWRVRAQPVAASGAPITALQSDAHPWPQDQFRTLTGLFHFLVSQVWDRVDYQREQIRTAEKVSEAS